MADQEFTPFHRPSLANVSTLSSSNDLPRGMTFLETASMLCTVFRMLENKEKLTSRGFVERRVHRGRTRRDRKSTRLNSSHSQISYAVFCLKKKNKCHEC